MVAYVVNDLSVPPKPEERDAEYCCPRVHIAFAAPGKPFRSETVSAPGPSGAPSVGIDVAGRGAAAFRDPQGLKLTRFGPGFQRAETQVLSATAYGWTREQIPLAVAPSGATWIVASERTSQEDERLVAFAVDGSQPAISHDVVRDRFTFYTRAAINGSGEVFATRRTFARRGSDYYEDEGLAVLRGSVLQPDLAFSQLGRISHLEWDRLAVSINARGSAALTIMQEHPTGAKVRVFVFRRDAREPGSTLYPVEGFAGEQNLDSALSTGGRVAMAWTSEPGGRSRIGRFRLRAAIVNASGRPERPKRLATLALYTPTRPHVSWAGEMAFLVWERPGGAGVWTSRWSAR